MILLLGIFSLIYFGPAVCYVLFAHFLARRKPWAIIVGIVLASLNLLFVLFPTVGLIAIAVSDQTTPWLLIPAAVVAIFVAALIQLIYFLARSFESLRYPPEPHGFEPIMAQAVSTPTEPPALS